MAGAHLLRRRVARIVLLLATLALGTAGSAQAAEPATFRDDAGLLTGGGRAHITQAAQEAHLRVVVITNAERFPSRSAWQAWLREHATDRGAMTIGLHAVGGQQAIDVVPGAETGLSQGEAQQGTQRALRTFNRDGVTAGIVQLIQEYSAMGARSPRAKDGEGPSWGWLLPIEEEHAAAYVQDVAARMRQQGVAVSAEVARGNVVDVVVEAAKEVDLVVMASRGRSGLAALWSASIGSGVQARAETRLLLLNPSRRGLTP